LGEYDESVLGRAKAGAPTRESYAGSVRLAPADPAPWPFPVSQVPAPDPFTPVLLTPIEWKETSDGPLIYGWRMHE
jgi:hypothetical protein